MKHIDTLILWIAKHIPKSQRGMFIVYCIVLNYGIDYINNTLQVMAIDVLTGFISVMILLIQIRLLMTGGWWWTDDDQDDDDGYYESEEEEFYSKPATLDKIAKI